MPIFTHMYILHIYSHLHKTITIYRRGCFSEHYAKVDFFQLDAQKSEVSLKYVFRFDQLMRHFFYTLYCRTERFAGVLRILLSVNSLRHFSGKRERLHIFHITVFIGRIFALFYTYSFIQCFSRSITHS